MYYDDDNGDGMRHSHRKQNSGSSFLEASSTETELFEKLLGAEVETTHRADGDLVLIKFLIREKKVSCKYLELG